MALVQLPFFFFHSLSLFGGPGDERHSDGGYSVRSRANVTYRSIEIGVELRFGCRWNSQCQQ